MSNVISIERNETLQEIGERIRKLLFESARLSDRADQSRIQAGRELVAVRPRVEKEGFGWEEWCKDNVRRSQGDIRKIMSLVKEGNDPVAALEQYREDTKDSVRKHRAYVSAVPWRDRVMSIWNEGSEEDQSWFLSQITNEE